MRYKTMTVEQVLVKDGQLQLDTLFAALEDAALDKAGVVLVADSEHTVARSCVEGCKLNSWGSVLWPMVGCAVAELVNRAKAHDADAWAVVARYFVLSGQPDVKAVKVGSLDEFLEVLGGKEVCDEQ